MCARLCVCDVLCVFVCVRAKFRVNAATLDTHTLTQFCLIWKCVPTDIKTFTYVLRTDTGIVKEKSALYDHIIGVKKWMKANEPHRDNRDEEFDGGNAKICREIFLKHLKHAKCVPRPVQHFTSCGNNLCANGFRFQKLWQNTSMLIHAHTHTKHYDRRRKEVLICF